MKSKSIPNSTQNQPLIDVQQAKRVGLNAVKCAAVLGICSQSTPLPALAIVSLALAAFNEIKPYSACRAIVTTIATLPAIVPIGLLVAHTEICPTPYLPSSLLKCGERIGALNVLITEKLLKALGMAIARTPDTITFLAMAIVSPAIEEIFYRGIIQELLLKRIPEMILKKVASQHAWIVNSVPCKVLRVAASATLFALIHTYNIECARGGGVPQFLSGLFYGYLTETSGSIAAATQLHMTHNAIFKVLHQIGPSN